MFISRMFNNRRVGMLEIHVTVQWRRRSIEVVFPPFNVVRVINRVKHLSVQWRETVLGVDSFNATAAVIINKGSCIIEFLLGRKYTIETVGLM